MAESYRYATGLDIGCGSSQVDTNLPVNGPSPLGSRREKVHRFQRKQLAIEFGESRGRQAITVTFLDSTTVGPVAMNDIAVVDPASGVSQGELYEFADERLPKAGWNWNLVNNDGSRGVHNPDFAFLALDSAIDALMALWVMP